MDVLYAWIEDGGRSLSDELDYRLYSDNDNSFSLRGRNYHPCRGLPFVSFELSLVAGDGEDTRLAGGSHDRG